MAIGATMSYLSDTETSAGNSFTAGAIDLKVDNESYYNGETFAGTTFGPSDLDNGLLIINFKDLKPDDEGEDTISLHVNNNDAWLCMDMALTSDDDISSNTPELKVDDPEDRNNTWDGELGDLAQMVWWVDDGDNVLEQGETLLSNGAQTVNSFFGSDKTFSADLADSTTNVWTGTPGPAKGSETYYIGKGWCFGNMTLNPVAPGNYDSPIGPQGSGFSCEGRQLGNESQTDGVTMDIAFRAIQARHNPNYTCQDEQPRLATLTVVKQIVNNDGGNNVIGDFQLKVIGTNVTYVTSGVPTDFAAGNYTVTETGISGYVASFSGDCNSVGQIALAPRDNKTCVITNNDLPANITVRKVVVGGSLDPSQFPLLVDGNLVQNNTSVAVTANSTHTINETQQPKYTFTSMTGQSSNGTPCPSALGGSITLDEGESIICTITNTYTP